MGRPKKELKRIHGRKVKKTKNKVKQFRKGELPFEKLSPLAKKILKRQKKKESKAS